jgi:hypothetical protein
MSQEVNSIKEIKNLQTAEEIQGKREQVKGLL